MAVCLQIQGEQGPKLALAPCGASVRKTGMGPAQAEARSSQHNIYLLPGSRGCCRPQPRSSCSLRGWAEGPHRNSSRAVMGLQPGASLPSSVSLCSWHEHEPCVQAEEDLEQSEDSQAVHPRDKHGCWQPGEAGLPQGQCPAASLSPSSTRWIQPGISATTGQPCEGPPTTPCLPTAAGAGRSEACLVF